MIISGLLLCIITTSFVNYNHKDKLKVVTRVDKINNLVNFVVRVDTSFINYDTLKSDSGKIIKEYSWSHYVQNKKFDKVIPVLHYGLFDVNKDTTIRFKTSAGNVLINLKDSIKINTDQNNILVKYSEQYISDFWTDAMSLLAKREYITIILRQSTYDSLYNSNPKLIALWKIKK